MELFSWTTYFISMSLTFVIYIIGLRIMVKMGELDTTNWEELGPLLGFAVFLMALGQITFLLLFAALFIFVFIRMIIVLIGGQFLPEKLHDAYIEWKAEYKTPTEKLQ